MVSELIAATGLTRRDVSEILKHVEWRNFDSEKFLLEAAQIINAVKAAQIAVDYTPLAQNLYDHLIYDSAVEKNFATAFESADNVAIYVKLPKSFNIPTPVGTYNPDWAMVFRAGYLIVETKGSSSEINLRGFERIKIACA